MTQRELLELGIPAGELLGLASVLVRNAQTRGVEPGEVRRRLQALVEQPQDHAEDPWFGSLAKALARPAP